LPLTKYKPDADAVETMAPPELSERAKEARLEILKRIVKSGNLLLPTDLYELYTARSCLAEGYPVHEGRFADVHLTDEEALARENRERFVGPLLEPEGRNLSSSMTVGDVFHSHFAYCWRLNMSLRAGPGYKWTDGIPEDKMKEMAAWVAASEFDLVMAMGKPARVCLVEALCAEHDEECSNKLYERAGNDHVFGGEKTSLKTLNHPQNMLAQCRGHERAKGEARLFMSSLLLKLFGYWFDRRCDWACPW